VLDPYRLVSSFIALIHIVCCLKTYLHETMQMGFVFFLRMLQLWFYLFVIVIIIEQVTS